MHEDTVAVDPHAKNILPLPPAGVLPVADEMRSPTERAEGQVQLRLRRIEDYLDAALRSPLAEVAMLGGVNADLAKLALHLNQSLEEVWQACRNDGEDAEAVYEGVTMLLKVTRQLERGTRLTTDLARFAGKSATVRKQILADVAAEDGSSGGLNLPAAGNG
jgi:hypothetical protein